VSVVPSYESTGHNAGRPSCSFAASRWTASGGYCSMYVVLSPVSIKTDDAVQPSLAVCSTPLRAAPKATSVAST
jgi:hypothetical protein